MKCCHRCEAEWVSDKREPGVKDICSECSAYLHCCLNCRFYDPSYHNQCQIGTTEWVGDKEACNFCDEFEFADAEQMVGRDGQASQAREAFDKLFGASEHKKAEDRLNDFKRIFGD